MNIPITQTPYKQYIIPVYSNVSTEDSFYRYLYYLAVENTNSNIILYPTNFNKNTIEKTMNILREMYYFSTLNVYIALDDIDKFDSDINAFCSDRNIMLITKYDSHKNNNILKKDFNSYYYDLSNSISHKDIGTLSYVQCFMTLYYNDSHKIKIDKIPYPLLNQLSFFIQYNKTNNPYLVLDTLGTLYHMNKPIGGINSSILKVYNNLLKDYETNKDSIETKILNLSNGLK